MLYLHVSQPNSAYSLTPQPLRAVWVLFSPRWVVSGGKKLVQAASEKPGVRYREVETLVEGVGVQRHDVTIIAQ